jgi:hypothetical protein
VAVGLYEEQYREDCVIAWNEYGESIDLLGIK